MQQKGWKVKNGTDLLFNLPLESSVKRLLLFMRQKDTKKSNSSIHFSLKKIYSNRFLQYNLCNDLKWKKLEMSF